MVILSRIHNFLRCYKGESQPFNVIGKLVAQLIAVGCWETNYGFKVQKFRSYRFQNSGLWNVFCQKK